MKNNLNLFVIKNIYILFVIENKLIEVQAQDFIAVARRFAAVSSFNRTDQSSSPHCSIASPSRSMSNTRSSNAVAGLTGNTNVSIELKM